MNIVDRRLNPRGKSLANRQRFIRRARKQILEAVREASARHGIADAGGDRIKISADTLREPVLHHSHRSGERVHVVPGNKEYLEGDRIPRPPSGGGGRGSEGAPDGDSHDAFQFVLNQDEFLDLFLEDLELPDMLRKQLRHADGFTPQRAGFRTTGSAANLNLLRTMRNSLSRRIALKRPRASELIAREEEIAGLDPEGEDGDRRRLLEHELEHQRHRSRRIPFIDPVDVRYNRFENVPRPAASAVMFCLMDVSGSMTAHMKDLAKRFYKLLYLFLSRRYRHVDIVFIRHTHLAREVDEETFFTSTESGGTIVSTAFEEMLRVLNNRYSRDYWNVYAAQASDGDNMPADNPHAVSLLQTLILPACQYFAYLEVGSEDGRHGGPTELWRAYQRMAQAGQPIAMRKVNHRSQIYPVFRQLFARDRATRQEAGA
ncbi:MAG: YeaH/YhbH family protein [Alphaproteobacteria bacterium]|nr:YeaH/YhbH family protein [Alphaproteobacteria bacterium]